ncbi:hypothetical protein HDV05_003454 [Chytridiales sp. JEL 0842]|nr:hypothetical protein HDV05_003454 [Chytridiales sp. JEL 0842]
MSNSTSTPHAADPERERELQVAIEAAKIGGALIHSAFHSHSSLKPGLQHKSCTSDLVTETDKAVEKVVFEYLRRHFPEYEFLGEESASSSTLTDRKTWVVDPVDGTMNFVHGFPYVALSIALLHHKQPTLGVVYNPILNELFTASLHSGSFLNNQPLPLHPPTPLSALSEALVATEYGYCRDGNLDSKLETIKGVLKAPTRGIRSLGSAALEACYVARGALDAYWEAGVHVWDVAAAAIIVRESGGLMVNFEPQVSVLDGKEVPERATEERLDLGCRKFLAVRAMPEGVEGVDRVVRMVRGHLRGGLEYERDY